MFIGTSPSLILKGSELLKEKERKKRKLSQKPDKLKN
jgi:hypothetical protein